MLFFVVSDWHWARVRERACAGQGGGGMDFAFSGAAGLCPVAGLLGSANRFASGDPCFVRACLLLGVAWHLIGAQ